MPLNVGDVYRRRGFSVPGADRMSRFGPTEPMPTPEPVTASTGKIRRAFRVPPERMPVTDASITRQAGLNEARAASSAPTVSDAVLDKDVPLFSRQGRRNHPIASSIALGAIYGAKAGDAARQFDEDERRQKAQDLADQERQEYIDAIRQNRASNRDAPAPEGMSRDPVTGKLYKTAKAPVSDEDLAPEQRKEFTIIGGQVHARPGAGAKEKAEKPEDQPQPPKGWKAPSGKEWVPGKGFQDVAGYVGPKQLYADIQKLRGEKVRHQREKAALEKEIAGWSDPKFSDDPNQASILASKRAELEDVNDAIRATQADIDARHSTLEESLPESPYTIEAYENEMTDAERAEHDLRYKAPTRHSKVRTPARPAPMASP